MTRIFLILLALLGGCSDNAPYIPLDDGGLPIDEGHMDASVEFECGPGVQIGFPPALDGAFPWDPGTVTQEGASNPPNFDGRYTNVVGTVVATFIVHPRGGAEGPYEMVFTLPTAAVSGTSVIRNITFRGEDPLSFDGGPCVTVTEADGIVTVTVHRLESAGTFTGGPTISAQITYDSTE